MVRAPKIGFFRDEHAFLSNFAPAPVVLSAERYPTVEHAFQAAKTLDPEARALIRGAAMPSTAKRLGRNVALRPHWEQMRIAVMRALLIQKFADPALRDKLLATYPCALEEGNTYSDCFWGVDARTGKGSNHLGKLLMEVRLNLHIQHVPLDQQAERENG